MHSLLVERARDCDFRSEVLVLSEESISWVFSMAPKCSQRGILGLGEVSSDNPDKDHVTRAQIQAQKYADFFKYFVPLVTRNEIESVADCLWDEAKAIPWEDLRCEFEP